MSERRSLTQDTIKQTNKQNLLNSFEEDDDLTVNDMISKTGLTPVTINAILKELQEEKWIVESHLAESSGGRKPWVYRFLENRNYLFQCFITKEGIIVNIMNLRGVPILEYEYPVKVQSNEMLNTALQRVISDTLNESIKEKLISISFHVSGIINNEEYTLLYSAPLNVRNFNFMALFPWLDKEKVPLHIFKRVDLLLMGSLSKDERKHKRSAYIMLKDGLGLSVMDGANISSLKRGGYELGHTLYQENGELIKLGEYFKEENMVGRYNEKVDVSQRINSVSQIFTKYREGEEAARKYIKNLVKISCVVSTNVVNTFAPDILYIGGDYTDIIKSEMAELEIRSAILEPFNDYLEIRFKSFEHKTMIKGITDYILSSRVFKTPFK